MIGYSNNAWLNKSKPVGMIAGSAFDTIKKHGLYPGCNGASFASADQAVVEFPDRGDLSRRAGKECLIRTVDFITGNALLDDWDADFCG